MFLSKLKHFLLLTFTFALVLSGQSFVFAKDIYSDNLIPKMTSNTSPEGIASASHQTENAFVVFDRKNTTRWETPDNVSQGWIAFEFPTETIVNRYYLFGMNPYDMPMDWSFEGWNGSEWVVLDQKNNYVSWGSPSYGSFEFNNTTPYIKYRINITDVVRPKPSDSRSIKLTYLEMSQKINTIPDPELDPASKNLIPKMTSNTSPEGIASASSQLEITTPPYHAFDHTDTNYGWSSNKPQGWLAYEFPTKTIVNKYTLLPSVRDNLTANPKTWTFEGWNGTEWVVLDSQNNIGDWEMHKKKEFIFNNNTPYIKYRINITATNGYKIISIKEMEMMNTNASSEPEPEPNPNPDPDPNPNPTGNALLVIYMDSGLIKEYEMTNEEIRNFTEWYEGRAKGNGKEAYIVNKKYNIGPFNSRKDFISYSHIESFEVQEYSR
ncbi:hypothetical protein [Brevibacillus laterosporus]|uniref:hypothetical protein n=1 Tax=Brevibacillus laterosporus TaxID=1465 RepID=UPI00264D306F|nr:hypothetical protein [Brevibacillus laterosporus]MDN9012879.1 hypothetical protein [Brevibacillus laterosporus]MDO0943956.1 hypothetical protein [Brevibacillus laterosporus]